MSKANVAVIYTGVSRTCETTLPFFKKNVIPDENHHVFCVVQMDENQEYYTSLLQKTMGKNVKSITTFEKTDIRWCQIKEILLNQIPLHEHWKNYLRNSGSMIEYYQMYLAFKQIEIYEKENNIRYDYILRTRTDIVLKDPIDFSKLKYYGTNEEDIENTRQLLYKIKNLYSLKTLFSKEILSTFMNVFYNERRLYYKNMGLDDLHICDNSLSKIFTKELETTETDTEKEDIFIGNIHNYIQKEKFVIALRKNVVYFMKRECMDTVHTLGISYGQHVLEKSGEWWFNAESQFQQICIGGGIDFYSSTSTLEDMSLYEYNPQNYFIHTTCNDQRNENVLIDPCDCSFFIKRS